jgi:hypothetical protein
MDRRSWMNRCAETITLPPETYVHVVQARVHILIQPEA